MAMRSPENPVFAKPTAPGDPLEIWSRSAFGRADETGVVSLITLIVAPLTACHALSAAGVPICGIGRTLAQGHQ
jgi:hypothetical protein